MRGRREGQRQSGSGSVLDQSLDSPALRSAPTCPPTTTPAPSFAYPVLVDIRIFVPVSTSSVFQEPDGSIGDCLTKLDLQGKLRHGSDFSRSFIVLLQIQRECEHETQPGSS